MNWSRFSTRKKLKRFNIKWPLKMVILSTLNRPKTHFFRIIYEKKKLLHDTNIIVISIHYRLILCQPKLMILWDIARFIEILSHSSFTDVHLYALDFSKDSIRSTQLCVENNLIILTWKSFFFLIRSVLYTAWYL